MQAPEIVIYLMCLFMYLFMDIGSIIGFYKTWIRNGFFKLYFPEWEGTKKPLIWFLIWSLVILCDIGVYTMLAFLLPYQPPSIAYGLAFFYTLPGILIVLFVYICVRNGIKEKQEDRFYNQPQEPIKPNLLFEAGEDIMLDVKDTDEKKKTATQKELKPNLSFEANEDIMLDPKEVDEANKPDQPDELNEPNEQIQRTERTK